MAVAHAAHAKARAQLSVAPRPSSLTLRLASFFALTVLCSLAYATLVRHPPGGRVVALAALATAGGAALALSGKLRSSRWILLALRGLAVALTLACSFAAIGVPVHLLAPARWGELAGDVERGLRGLRSWTWPYSGTAHWTRLAVLMLLAPWMTAVSALCFWPSQRRIAGRRTFALAMAIAVMVAGLANQPPGAWRAEGLLVALVIFAWLWLPTLRALDAARAFAWALACVAGALIAAPLLWGSGAWIAFGQGHALPATQFQWDQLYGPIEWSRSKQTMFTLTAAKPSLLRVTSLDRFDGLRFIRSDAPPETATLDVPPTSARRSWFEPATITIGQLRSNLLVGGEGLVARLGWPDGTPHPVQDEPDGTLALSSPLPVGARYQVLSYVPKPTAAELRAAPRALPAPYLPYTEFELPGADASALHKPDLAREAAARPLASQLVRVPALGTPASAHSAVAGRILASPYAPMFALARRLAAGQRTSYEVAERIERFLLSNYTYDEDPPLRRYPLEAFLFEDRRGYCQQFSGAMTLMLRMDGIPARVGVGFKPTIFDGASGTWAVRALDAHAWVEVFFAGIGWVSFDPTPATPRNASLSTATTSKASLVGAGSTAGGGGATKAARKAARRRSAGGGVPALLILAACALALAALAALALAIRRRSSVATDSVSRAIGELDRALSKMGWSLSPAMTLTQLVERLERVEQRDAAAYVAYLRELRYGPPRLAPARDLAAAKAKRGALRRALARGRGLSGRLRAIYLLPPRVGRP